MGVIYASTAEAVAVINHIYYWGDLHYSTFVGPDRAEDMNPAGRAQRLGIPFSIEKYQGAWDCHGRQSLPGGFNRRERVGPR